MITFKMASLEEGQSDALKSAITKRRKEKEKEDETQDHFEAEFAKQKKEVDDLIASIPHTPKESLRGTFDEISKKLNGLTKLVSDSVLFIPKYTVKTYHQKISELQQMANKSEEELFPKQKFSFKSRKTVPGTGTAGKAATITPTPPPPPPTSSETSKTSSPKSIILDKRTSDTIELQSSIVNGYDVSLSELTSCTVRIYGTPGILTITKCLDTKILSGPVQRSVFVEDCNDCHFVVGCQQLRVHSTLNSCFYIHVTSRAIIEDSKGLQFAPYNWSYPEYESHLLLSGLSPQVNNWDKVDDFNWLSSKEHSPNWALLPEDLRQSSWDNSH